MGIDPGLACEACGTGSCSCEEEIVAARPYPHFSPDDAPELDKHLFGHVEEDPISLAPLVDQTEEAQSTFGRLVESASAVSNYPAVNTGVGRHARLWVISFQQTGRVPPKGFVATLTYGIGQASFTRTINHFPNNVAPAGVSGPLPPYHVLVYGRYVDVALTRANVGLSVQVSIAPAESMSVEGFYAYRYGSLLGAGADAGVLSGQIVTGAGVLVAAHVIYNTLGPAAGTPFYPMFFDATSQPANGIAPILVLDGLRQVGDGSSFEDQTPGALMFATGLFFSMSTTPDFLTVAEVGSVIVPAVKIGG